MVRRKNELTAEKKPGLMGGAGECVITSLLAKDELYGHGRLLATITVPSKSSIGIHTHSGEFEMYYILEGVAEVTDDSEKVTLLPGDVHVCPDGHSHGVVNNGDTDLIIAAVILNTK